MAVFVYYSFRSGKLVFTNGTKEPNLYFLSILVIFSGVFPGYTYDRLREAAFRLFGKVKNNSSVDLNRFRSTNAVQARYPAFPEGGH